MDWDQLRVFHAVAQAGSFTGAAEALKLSQSAVSRRIHALEERLGVALFHRHARGLHLTEQGEILDKTAQAVASEISLAGGRLSDVGESSEGPLVITVSYFIGSTWLAPRLKLFKERHPQIQLTVLFDDRVLDLGMREADVALRLGTPGQDDLVQRLLKTIHFHICASQEYLSSHGALRTVEDLKDHALIAFPDDTNMPFPRPNWLFDIAGVNLEKNCNVLMMNSMHSIYEVTRSGAGIAVLPDYLIERHETLTPVLEELEPPGVDMYFVYAGERRNSKRIALFRDFLLETLGERLF